MITSGPGELNVKSRLGRVESRRRPGRVADREEILQDLAAVTVRHVARSGDTDEHGSAQRDGLADRRPVTLREGPGLDVAEDDDIEALPLGRGYGKRGCFSLAERARSTRRDDRGGAATINLVGIEEDILEVDRLVPTVEEIAQVTKLPARVAVDEEDIGAVVGDGDFKIPFVVLFKDLARIGLQPDAVVLDPFSLGKMDEVHFGTEADIGHVDGDGVDDLVT